MENNQEKRMETLVQPKQKPPSRKGSVTKLQLVIDMPRIARTSTFLC